MQRTKDLDTPELLDQLPALQQLLFRVLGCQVYFRLVVSPIIKHFCLFSVSDFSVSILSISNSILFSFFCGVMVNKVIMKHLCSLKEQLSIIL